MDSVFGYYNNPAENLKYCRRVIWATFMVLFLLCLKQQHISMSYSLKKAEQSLVSVSMQTQVSEHSSSEWLNASDH